MPVSLAWYGVSTFRLEVDGTVLFLDAYMDRVAAAPPVGLSAAQVQRADYVLVGHAHFDHLAGADTIALNTGATIMANYESIRLAADAGVPDAQLVAVSGGEPVQLTDDLRVRVFPGLHSCVWSGGIIDADAEVTGDDAVTHQQRMARMRTGGQLPPGLHSPRGDGGALGYLLETRHGTIWFSDTSGYWTGVVDGLRPDVAILAVAGRGNIDGQPIQGSLAGFVAGQAALLRPRRVVYCHHDDWMPGFTHGRQDTAGVTRRIHAEAGESVDTIDPEYDTPMAILDGLPG
jgi:L-ascorbate metabolism protein UlaG (beta-lactamase superfamily)